MPRLELEKAIVERLIASSDEDDILLLDMLQFLSLNVFFVFSADELLFSKRVSYDAQPKCILHRRRAIKERTEVSYGMCRTAHSRI
jgi:hypothetical protein